MTSLLVLNCGSTTVKYKFYPDENLENLAIAANTVKVTGNYHVAIEKIFKELPQKPSIIAHRIVHGGAHREATLIDGALINEITRFAEIAPLHNPPALTGIKIAQAMCVPMVAVFDTAFHQTMPEYAYRYALPNLADGNIRRYGFHGLSHRYVTERYRELSSSSKPTLITLHLGAGCSAAAIRHGICIDTSMGFSPCEGLMMGTRAGDIDPMIVLYLQKRGYTVSQLETMLNMESGLLAIAGDGDMEHLLTQTHPDTALALDMFCYRIRKYIGAYMAVLEGEVEAIIFTGGIGENAAYVRERSLAGFAFAGLFLDVEKNLEHHTEISAQGSKIKAFIIRTDEESLIARDAFQFMRTQHGKTINT